ncbi:MAG: peptidylprolyl isomerase [Planctomycetota bacterium]|nr:peptidylprolyl isomerase [Planctomycetota bacterium]
MLALLLASGPAAALDVPEGAMPKIDGNLAKEEWAGAVALKAGRGTLRLRVAQGALCLALEMEAPYAGERLDLHVTDSKGRVYVRHSLHPACYLPRFPFMPIAPVLVYRGEFARRAEARVATPHGCLARARIHTKEKRWTLEAAISMDALELTTPGHHHFLVEAVDPFGEKERLTFTTPDPTGKGPEAWPLFVAPGLESAKLFETPTEDEVRGTEARIFGDRVARMTQAEPKEGPVREAFDGQKNNAKIKELVRVLTTGVERDGQDLFGRVALAHVLRRANRLDESAQVLDALVTEMDFASGLKPVLVERFELLFALGRFDDAAQVGGRLGLPTLVRLAGESGRAWHAELLIKTPDPARLRIRTSKGSVTIELFSQEGAAAFLLKAAKAGELDGAEFGEVTGGVQARARFETSAKKPQAEIDPKRHHWRGSVGVSWGRGGKPELYFTTKRMPWLDAKSPVVGRVVTGQDVVDRLEHGDTIRNVEVGRR